MGDAHVRGKVVTAPLDKLKPNTWNPNVVTPEKMASIEHGFRTDGWLVSQALLVWRKDETGKVQNVIVDGEHRWKAARSVGLTEGPVVFLDGITEAEAKALTVKLDQKRGRWDEDKLGALLREIGGASEDVALDFGFDGGELARLLGGGGTTPVTPEGPSESGSFLDEFGPRPAGKDAPAGGTKEDGLFAFSIRLTAEQDVAVQAAIRAAKKRFGVSTNLEAILAVFNEFVGATK
jgi:hypothetical protein